jgi:hypothetical protein
VNGLRVDLKLASRVFLKSPVFAGIVVLTLALGIGAHAAILSLLDQVALRLLPLERPYRLVVLSAPASAGGTRSRSETVDPASQPTNGASAIERRRSPSAPTAFRAPASRSRACAPPSVPSSPGRAVASLAAISWSWGTGPSNVASEALPGSTR